MIEGQIFPSKIPRSSKTWLLVLFCFKQSWKNSDIFSNMPQVDFNLFIMEMAMNDGIIYWKETSRSVLNDNSELIFLIVLSAKGSCPNKHPLPLFQN